MKHFDVAIVGAGPAGSSAAIHLARKGYSVALLDKEQFPREKLCGDFLNPINWPVLRELEIDREVLACPHEKVTMFRFTSFSGDEAEVPLPGSQDGTLFGLGVRRFDLDYVLLKKAECQGAKDFQKCKLIELKPESQGWLLRFDREGVIEALQTRVLIGADGRNSRVAHCLGLAGSAAMQERAIGFQLQLKCTNATDGKVEIHLFPGGYAGVVGLGGNTFNLCLTVDKARFQYHRSLRRLMERCLSINPHLAEILRRSEPVSEARSVYPVYFPPRRSYGHEVLLVGDAARVNEPVTGEGIYFALKSGELAAGTIDQAFRRGDFSTDQLSSYHRECRSGFRMRRGINAIVRWLIYRPSLLSPLIGLSKKRTGLLHSMVQMICHPEITGQEANLVDSGPFVVR